MVFTLILTALISAGSAVELAAQQKIGYINANELIMSMPERDSAAAQVEAKRQEFIRQSEELQVEFNKKYEAFTTQQATLSTLIRQTKEAELQDMSKNIETFNAAADQELTRINQELFQPILESAQAAIKEVALENGFTYILDIGGSGAGAVIYFPEDDPSLNVLPLVKKKLGLE